MITECPSDETGNSSVAPCSRPMNSACARDSAGSPALSRSSLRRELFYGPSKQVPGIVELSMDRLVLSSLQDRHDLRPAIGITFLQGRAHLTDCLCREQEATAGVVEDLAGKLQLAAGPRDDLVSGLRLQLLRP